LRRDIANQVGWRIARADLGGPVDTRIGYVDAVRILGARVVSFRVV
jgi:hypothetical protein